MFDKSIQSLNSPQHLNQEVLYRLENISVHYNSFKALENIDLKIHMGEILFITGISGAGKSTLLKLIGEEVAPLKGEFKNYLNQKAFVGKVFQDLRLIENQSCENNLWYSYDRAIYKNKNEFYEDMIQLAKIFGIQEKLHLEIKNANGGLKQKIAILRSLLARPNVLLADEPTSSLDKDNANKLFDILKFYNQKRGLTIIWASHNRELVKQFGGRIVHLNNGKLVHSGHACFI